MGGPKNALAAWGASALRPIELPSGMRALLKLPDVADLVRKDSLPEELRALASKYATEGIDLKTLSPEEVRKFVVFTYDLIGRALRYIAPPGSDAWDRFLTEGGSPADEGWEPISVKGHQIADEMDVDAADLEALSRVVGRRMTPNEVTALSRYDRKLLTEGETLDVVREESGGRVSDFATFRGQPGSADDGTDGEDVRPEPGARLPADQRPGHRLRGRRGARA